MKYIKIFENKLNYIVIIFFGLILIAHSAAAVILDGYNKYSLEELIINDIIGNIFMFVLIISVPMFVIGVIRGSKKERKDKNFSIILFIGVFLSYFLLAFFILVMLITFFMGYIYNCYPYFAYIVTGVLLIFVCVFAKVSAKILKSDFLVVLSLFLIIVSVLISRSIT